MLAANLLAWSRMKRQETAGGTRRGGFSLLEMLIVVVLLGLLTLMSMPRIERALVRRDLAGARAATTSLIARAKSAAVQRRRPVTLAIDSSLAVLSSGPQFLALVHYQSLFGVRANASAASLTVQPTGLVTTGTPFTIRFTKGSRTDSVLVTGYGRVQ